MRGSSAALYGLPRAWASVYNIGSVAEHLGAFEQAVLLPLERPRTELGREGYGRAILIAGSRFSAASLTTSAR